MNLKLNAIFIRRILWIGTFVLASFGAEYASGADRYWVGNGGNWSDSTTHWATNSGGTADAAYLPTSSDNVYFDASSFNSASQTVRVDVAANCADMVWTGLTNTPTFAGSSNLYVYGSLTFVSGMTQTYSGTITFAATDTEKTFTAGRTLACAVTFDGVGGGWTLQDNLNIGSKTITLTRGNLNLNGVTNTCGIFNISGTNTRTLTCGASTINCTGQGNSRTWDAELSTGLTLNANTSTIIFNDYLNKFYGGGQTYHAVKFNNDNAVIYGTNTFAYLTKIGTSAAWSDAFTFTTNQTITGTLTFAGAPNRIYVTGGTLGASQTLTAASVVASNADFQGITGAPASNWDLSAITGGSGDCYDNSGITFTPATNLYWVATIE